MRLGAQQGPPGACGQAGYCQRSGQATPRGRLRISHGTTNPASATQFSGPQYPVGIKITGERSVWVISPTASATSTGAMSSQAGERERTLRWS